MPKKTLLEKMREATNDIFTDPKAIEARKMRRNFFETNFNLHKGIHMSQEQGIQITDFITGPVSYDPHGSQYFFINQPGGGQQMLAEMRGWGAIQNLPAFKDADGNIEMDQAAKFQDDIGNWIAAAINEKLEREILEAKGTRTREQIYDDVLGGLGIKSDKRKLILIAMEDYRKQGRYYSPEDINGIQEQAYQEGINAQLT